MYCTAERYRNTHLVYTHLVYTFLKKINIIVKNTEIVHILLLTDLCQVIILQMRDKMRHKIHVIGTVIAIARCILSVSIRAGWNTCQ